MRTELFELYDNIAMAAPAASEAGSDIVSILKIISIVISILLVIASAFLIYKLRKGIGQSIERVEESVSAPGLVKEVFDENWQSVLDKMDLEDESSWKLAVIEADKILDDVLKRIGYQGEDMGERLKQITKTQLASIDEVWQAHKMRNNIVHDPGYQVSKGQARRAIEIYQRALQDMEAL